MPFRDRFLRPTVIALLCGAMLAVAQTTSTSILGTVTDPSGAAVTGAEVTIERVARGLARRVTTNDAGFYSAPALDPGEYNITVEKSGFKKNVHSAVALRVNQKLTQDFVLEIGAVGETVSVV